MTKKAPAVLLALALLCAAVPLAAAAGHADGWLLYSVAETAESFTATVVAPSKYMRMGDHPQIEAVYSADRTQNRVYAAEAGQITYYYGGKAETHRTLTVTCAVPDGSVPGYDLLLAVLPASLLDGAGNGNPRVFFDDGTEYYSAGGYAEIDVYSALLRRDYDKTDDTVAVGDTLKVDHSGLYPAEVFVNGAPVFAFCAGDIQRYTLGVTETGTLDVAVRQGDRIITERTLTVITSGEMYERNLRDGLITSDDIPGTHDLIDVGVPAGSPFILIAKIAAFFNALRIFFERLFSFTRITS
ncbi:MAG: hypothetical protein IJT27_02605 [Clostridia bacterium]|nr:hypothetical protein [Clostridia bacterium]